MRQGFLQIAQACPHCQGMGKKLTNPCGTCSGEGRVRGASRIRIKIPSGVTDGARLRSEGNGDAGRRGGPAGNLYVGIHIKSHDLFEREGHDLHLPLPVDLSTAARGGEVIVPTLSGKASMKIPAGTQNGTTLRMRGKGLPAHRGHPGDLYVHVNVEIPTNLNDAQQQLLKAFTDSLTSANRPQAEGFREKAARFFR
jgi:molecular chaperone DnaJ